MTRTLPRSTAPPRESSGYVLLSVLVAVGVITGLVAAYGRHVVVEGRSGMAAGPLLEAREACFSGVGFARQSVVTGAAAGTQTIPSGSCSATISVASLPLGNQALVVQSLGVDGLGARRTLEVGVTPSPDSAPSGPATLPTLGASTVAALLADSSVAKHQITRATVFQGVELDGLLVVHPGVQLTLDDVVLEGAVVSSTVMDGSPLGAYDADGAPTLRIDGNLRIDPHPSLPRVAVVLPDGAVASGPGDARVQIFGDVVAHDLALSHAGTLSGHVAAVQQSLSGSLDRLGADRREDDWSQQLDMGGRVEPVFVAAVPPSTDVGALGGIIDYWSAP